MKRRWELLEGKPFTQDTGSPVGKSPFRGLKEFLGKAFATYELRSQGVHWEARQER